MADAPKADDPKKGHQDDQHDENRRANLAADYGWSEAFLRHHPELEKLFDEAVQHNWTPNRFVAELKDTNWYQNTSATMRQYLVNRSTDPASWEQDMLRMSSHVRDTYGNLLGIPLSKDQAQRFAKHAMMFGWTDEQLTDRIMASVDFTKKNIMRNLGGTAAQTMDQLGQLQAAYGVKVGPKFTSDYLERILSGDDTIDGAANALRELAKSKYTAFSDQLDGGKTMADIADPYIQSMSSLLELNPNALDVGSNLVQHALTRRVDGKPNPMSLSQFEDFVRQDPRWMHTQQAKDQFLSIGAQLGRQWGLVA